ncbi:MAG: reprolysin-like metallopeptidase [Bacteroidota bacterium]
MKKNCVTLLVFFVLIINSQLIAQEKIWSKINRSSVPSIEVQKKELPKKFQIYQLEIESLQKDLLRIFDQQTTKNIQFPDENGKMEVYQVRATNVMHPDLAKRYPNNRSFVGHSVEDRSKKIRFSLNELGLHAMLVDNNRKVLYVDPYSYDKKKYIFYLRKDMNSENFQLSCFTKQALSHKKTIIAAKSVDDKKLRTYRLALASTGEYSDYHINAAGMQSGTEAQKKAVVLAAMTTAITRVNDIYENDLAVSLQLIGNNDALIFLDSATDPYTNDDGSAMLNENQTTCDNTIGSSNYDIGHVFSTGGGGIAALASACTSSKARGVTGSANPTGDYFYFDFVAHEMGHQFGANHTFNSEKESCGGNNRNDPTAVEPGSGTTLMAYAGICAPDNVQSHSDFYFHAVSIDEIWTNISTGNSSTCGTKTSISTNNNVPIANAGNDIIIPISTPYILKGQGSDADGDPISFCWEQIDNEITDVPPSETATSGALYRSKNPTEDSKRYMPLLSTVVQGSISSTWEVTPSVAREMNFRLTVRDNNTVAGQIASDEMKITVTNSAGPFVITSQNSADLAWTKNTQETITWDVAGTSANGINVSHVNILLSTDGGKTFTTSLVSNTPNDGTQSINVPNISASKCFVMVEAVGNFFYSVNLQSFSIGEFNEVCNDYIVSDTDVPLSIPDNDLNGVISSISVADNSIIEAITVSVKVNHTFVHDLTLTLESPTGKMVELLSKQCFGTNADIDAVFDDSGVAVSCKITAPTITGTIKPTQELSNLIGENSAGSWKLKIVDSAAEDIGEIESWSLNICTSEEVVGINNYAFNNFKVFPNPSDGVFKVEFTSKELGDTEIQLFDLLGRKVFKKVFKNNQTSFSESIDLKYISSGFYLLKVQRGKSISSKKIRINSK